MFAQLSGEPDPEPSVDNDELSGDIRMSVHAIDVGQGDCTLIRVDGKTILIDAGENGKGRSVIEYIDDLGIDKLDYVIGTHPHSDHIGGLDTVLYEIKAETLIIPNVREDLIPTNDTYSDFLDSALDAKEDGMKIIQAMCGDVYQISSDSDLRILSPLKDDYSDLNDFSVAVVITCGNTSFFAGGDITCETEIDLIEQYPDLDVELIKLSHHGGNESNSYEFIRHISPDYAFISCGIDNTYGHPKERILDILDNCGVKYRRTDIEGSLVYYSDGQTFIEG